LRGDSDRLVDDGLDERAAVDLVARVRKTPDFVEMNRQLAEMADRMLTRPCRPMPTISGSAAMYRAITEGARAVIVAVHPGNGWTALSDAFESVLGYNRHGPPDRRLLDLVHPDDRALAMEAYLICCSGRHPVDTVDVRVRAADGAWRTMEVTARTFIEDPDVGVVVFFGIDVTVRREAERGARVEHRRLTKLVETMDDGVVLLDGDHRVCLANAAAYRLLDVPDSRPPTWNTLVDGLALDDQRARRLREAVHDTHALVGQEIPFVDGRVLELDVVPVRPEGSGVLVHVRDVTARVAVRRGLEERSRGLEERNRALVEATALNNQFVATVSHELRGPLSSVVAFSHLLGDAAAGELSEDQRTYLDVIDRNANRLLRLIEDLLLLSRLESRTLQLNPAPVRLRDVLSVAVAERRPAALNAEIDLHLECPDDGPDVVCDDTRVHQVVDNLLNNALKFTPAGGEVTVRARVEGDFWLIEVADSGVGIPAADLPRLFSAFFRGSNATASVGRQIVPGTGLGLVVSRAIVELHGGTISVASTEGVGTTVTLSLPTRPARTGGES
jgi:PAS domain S-box-containing protein